MSTRSRILVGGLVLIVASAFLTYVVGGIFAISPPEVSVKAEPVFYIHDGFHMGVPHEGGFVITNSMIMAVLVTIVLGVLSFMATRNMQVVPRGFQNFVEMVVEGMYNTFGSVDRRFIARFWPVVGTIFFYVLFSNWLALIPGVLSIGYRVPESELHGEEARIAPGTLAHIDTANGTRVSDVVVPAPGSTVNYQGEGEGDDHSQEAGEHMVLVP